MDLIHNVKAIQKELYDLADKTIAEHSQRFFKTGKGEYGEGDVFLGVRVPILRKLARKYREISIPDAVRLLHSSYHEERLLALFILVGHFKKAGDEEKERIFRLYLANTEFINNWDLVDSSAEHVVGAFLLERDKGPIYKLVRSKDLWERRIAIISTFHFIRNNKFVDTLKIANILLQDKEDLIHKAVGWMLRETGKRNREVEENFLKKHYKNMPRTMLRYAIEKFPESQRKKYLKGHLSE